MIAELVEICEDWSVEPGTARRVEVNGRALAVFNVDGGFHVTDDTCTHGFASLAGGTLAGHIITCPWHGGAFDVRTGQPMAAPCTAPLAVHPCELRDGVVWARFK
jgi:nitrite reductase/ring-hydroxylating ferredoxin subunit